MEGWKTWLAAIGGIAGGFSLIISGLVSDPVNPDKMYEGYLVVMAGLAVIGIGHKVEKSSKK